MSGAPLKLGIVCYPTVGGSGVVATEVALHAARNADSIPLFVDRAKGYLQREDAALLSDEYRQLARQYLQRSKRVVGIYRPNGKGDAA